jgi:thimet oligopeptidase
MLTADVDPAALEALGAECVERAREALEAFLALPAGTAFGEVVAGFDRIRQPLDRARGPAGLASQVHPREEVREAAFRVEQALSSFDTDLGLDRAVFERLAALDPAEAPGPEERRLLAHALRDYRRSGVDRDEATRERVRALSDELVRIGQRFDAGIAADTRRIELPPSNAGAEALAGLPEDYVEAHLEAAGEGPVAVTTNPPDFVPFMTYARDAEARRRLQFEYLNRAHPKNLEVLDELIARRHELATLLGFESWADYVTQDKMVGSARAAREFIERIAQLARPRMLAEYEELLEAKRRDHPEAERVDNWETAYYTERVKERRFGFDSQAVRPYFAYRSVRDGVLATSAALYGVEFRRDDETPRWHPSVECYEVLDGGAPVARVWLDMHPRPDKYKHAAMFDLRTGIAGGTLPEAALVCNFPEPTERDPALLLHGQVTTFFHEFGHLLHHLFGGRQRYYSFSGIATEWDFVEAPSQMYEEWAWDAGVLQRFARHHRTGEAIPEDLVSRMRGAEEYGKGLHVGTQMYFAMLSLTYFQTPPDELDTTATMIALRERMTPVPHHPGTHFHTAFGHLNGYSAIYYTYMWSLVIAKDLFSRFDGDLMNGDTAGRYRQTVLAPGGSKDAAELVRDFLGRDYAFEAWETWLDS